MLQPHRTRSLRRIKVKLPGGRITIHYKKRKPKKATCIVTKKPLPGVPRYTPVKLRKLPKSQRRPNRPYGGMLSSKAMRIKIIDTSNIVNHPLEVGRLIVKTAGRDSGKIGVIIEKIDNNYVLIDGQVRRRKCNIDHLETLDKKIKIKSKATFDSIQKEFKLLGIEAKKTKPKQRKDRPKKQRKQKEKTKEEPAQKKVEEKNPKKEVKKPKAKPKKKEIKKKTKKTTKK